MADALRVELEVERQQFARCGRRSACRRGRAGCCRWIAREAAHQRAWRSARPARQRRARARPSRRAAPSNRSPRAAARRRRGRSASGTCARADSASMRSTEWRSASGSNCTGVVVGMIQAPAAVSNSRYDRPKVSPVKKPAAALVPDAVVVPRVAGRVEELQRPAGELERHAVGVLSDALGRHADDVAVGARHFLGAVDRASRRPSRRPGRSGAARRRGCTTSRAVRQLLHQQADAAGMVEVHVGRR